MVTRELRSAAGVNPTEAIEEIFNSQSQIFYQGEALKPHYLAKRVQENLKKMEIVNRINVMIKRVKGKMNELEVRFTHNQIIRGKN